MEVGFTVHDPTRVEVDNVPGVMATEDAFVIPQESALAPAEATTVGEALKEEMVGDEPLPPLLGAISIVDWTLTPDPALKLNVFDIGVVVSAVSAFWCAPNVA